jgi:hypothetical protein
MPDQYLQVDLLVAKDKAGAFEDLSANFQIQQNGFAGILNDTSQPPRYQLLLALRSTATFPYQVVGKASGTLGQASPFDHDFYRQSVIEPATPVYRYVHLWKIRDPADLNLAPLMRVCGENKTYIQIDALVLAETQNFVTRVRTPGAAAPPFIDAPRFVRTTRVLSHTQLGVYILLEPMLYPVLEKAGWHHLGQYQTFSGQLNIVTEFWQTTSEYPLNQMFASVQAASLPVKAPASALGLFTSDVRESYTKLPYSLGTSL